VHREDYVNPTTDGELSWRSVHSYDTDSEDAMDRWKNKLYEVSTYGGHQCLKMLRDIASVAMLPKDQEALQKR
jgi:hypothetical protein